jgi:Tfp pilus assembly protein PilO
MNELDVQLDNLDEQLHVYEPKTRWALYIGTALGILVMGWTLYLSDAIGELSALQEQNQALVTQVSDNSPDAYRAKIAKSSAAIIAEERNGAALETEKQTLLLQMEATKGLVFDNRQYAKMLDLLLERSVKLGLKIELMESEDANQTFFGKIKQFKKLTVSGAGNFPAIADFLTFTESQNALMQIESVQIRSDNAKPRFEAVILYMGVAL